MIIFLHKVFASSYTVISKSLYYVKLKDILHKYYLLEALECQNRYSFTDKIQRELIIVKGVLPFATTQSNYLQTTELRVHDFSYIGINLKGFLFRSNQTSQQLSITAILSNCTGKL